MIIRWSQNTGNAAFLDENLFDPSFFDPYPLRFFWKRLSDEANKTNGDFE